MKCAFVVLHYCLYDVTKECIDSILLLEGEKAIIVVDNASPDKSGSRIKDEYAENNLVHVILNNKNIGFSAGNNVGYKYAKETIGAEIIIVLNNDTLILDKCFLEKLINLCRHNNAHLIGPDILTYKGYHQNPFRIEGIEIEQIKKKYRKSKVKKIVYSLPFLYKLWSLKPKDILENKDNYNRRLENVVLHGSAIIFTERWIENEDFAFYPGTFMYFEEDLLYYYAMSKGYKTLFEPSIQIMHLEDMSTNTVFIQKRKKVLFQTTHKIHSLKLLLDFTNNMKNEG